MVILTIAGFFAILGEAAITIFHQCQLAYRNIEDNNNRRSDFATPISYKEVGPKYLGESGNSDGIRDLRFIRLVQIIMGEFLIISKFS